MERVTAAEHTERKAYGESFLWETSVKTTPEPPVKFMKPRRMSALKARIDKNPQVKI